MANKLLNIDQECNPSKRSDPSEAIRQKGVYREPKHKLQCSGVLKMCKFVKISGSIFPSSQ
jgi:hypothetical protein